MYGEVTTIGLRDLRMVTHNMMVEIDFHLDLSTNLALARETLFEVATTSRFVYLKKAVTVVFTEMAIANRISMQLKVKCYVIDVRFEKALQMDILYRGNKALIARGVKRPQFSIRASHITLTTLEPNR